ncbi:MAG: prepilin-type N-terminal cleavage/methylation domain-containing protein [Thermodesulfobacteriota bacterium]
MSENHYPGTGRQGFTLIELMIVVAILGLLAIMAIPNYISYRNKAFCSHAEADASIIAGEIASYFAIPSHTTIDKSQIAPTPLTNATWDIISADPNLCITITVQDDSGRCSRSYQEKMAGWKDGVYTKTIRR